MADANEDRKNDWIERGAKWGAIIGLLGGHLYVSANTLPSLGFYTGSAFMVFIVGVLAVIVAGESWLLWRVAVALGVLERFEERLAHLAGALHLLTDTAESGFTSFAGALTDAAQPSPRARSVRRRRTLTSRASVAADAGDRDATEGELRLRLQMAEIDRLSRYAEKEA